MKTRRKPIRIRSVVTARRKVPTISFASIWREVADIQDVCVILKNEPSSKVPKRAECSMAVLSTNNVVQFPKQ